MLARAGLAPSEAGWALEVKSGRHPRPAPGSDGRRVCVRSRPGRDCTADFSEPAAIAEALAGRRVILANPPHLNANQLDRLAQAGHFGVGLPLA
jgi:hypothetical protein